MHAASVVDGHKARIPSLALFVSVASILLVLYSSKPFWWTHDVTKKLGRKKKG